MPAMASFGLLVVVLVVSCTQLAASVVEDNWLTAQATVYGDELGTINSGACGYGNRYDSGYGTNTAAVSSVLFNDGAGCGRCYEIKCDITAHNAARRCTSGKTVVVTATNLCPNTQHSNAWCNPRNKHFDITNSAFSEIGSYSTGNPVPILYRSVPCTRAGGIQFTINGDSRYNLVLLTNVGGSGEVKSLLVKGTKTAGWIPLTRTWGSNWRTPQDMRGQSLSFEVQLKDGSSLISYDVVPASWQLGQTFKGHQFP